jgi:hypothetical protein
MSIQQFAVGVPDVKERKEGWFCCHWLLVVISLHHRVEVARVPYHLQQVLPLVCLTVHYHPFSEIQKTHEK